MPDKVELPKPSPIEFNRIVSMAEVRAYRSLSGHRATGELRAKRSCG